jgi:predicted glycosyltransferase involved in capsule biosynthesis
MNLVCRDTRASNSYSHDKGSPHCSNLGLFFDVDLTVTVRFFEKQILQTEGRSVSYGLDCSEQLVLRHEARASKPSV